MEKEQMLELLKYNPDFHNAFLSLLQYGWKNEKEEEIDEVFESKKDYIVLENEEEDVIEILQPHYFLINKSLKTYFRKEQ